MKRRNLLYVGTFIILSIIMLLYSNWVSPTRIATLNYPDFSVEKFIRSNNNSMVKIESVPLDRPEKIKGYDMVLVRVHGASMDSLHLNAIEEAIAKGVPVYSSESDNEKINSLQGQELQYIATLLDNSSVKNNQSLFNYIRKHIDGKKVFNKEYYEPVIVPSEYFFYLGDDNFFATYNEYEKFYKESGKYKEGAPRVALLSGNINLQNSNEEHIAALINSLESRGLNVYPINSFGSGKLDMIKDVEPDLIINNPHGRLVMAGAEKGEKLLKELNVPILAPVTVSDLYDNWLKSKQGLEQGGLTSMSVVLPELDGAIAPFAIAAQFERNGYNIFDAIPNHTEKFCSMVENYIKLQNKDNSDKRVAIYYYKGVGKGTINAADLEGVQSLYNTLNYLKESGYNVDGLPSSAKELEKLVQKQGSVLGAYALGAYDEFIKGGNPELVPVSEYNRWAEDVLPEELIGKMKEQYGEAPGDYMGYEKDGKKYIAVARLQFGNVAILPQPMFSTGKDINALTHGVDGAAAYPYVASYLWTRKGFKADAMIHFGTHGSLEFIPGKQLALSDYDWTDALVGDMPHFYLYTINDVGEGVIAKRRSYATLIDHLTAPFMQGELYGDLQKLSSNVHRFETLEEGELKQEYRKTITELAKAQNICSALGLDSSRVFTNEDVERVHAYLEEIDGAKVSDGLYTLGEMYTQENADNTIKLMMQDPVRYALATIDVSNGKIASNKLDDIVFIAENYSAKANNIVNRALRGESGEKIFNSIVTKKDAVILKEAQDNERKKAMAFEKMIEMAMSAPAEEEKSVKFLDEKGCIIERDSAIIAKKKMRGHPSWIPIGDGAEMPKEVKEKLQKSGMMPADKRGSGKKSDSLSAGSMATKTGSMATKTGGMGAKTGDVGAKTGDKEAKKPSVMERMAKTISQDESGKDNEQEELVAALKSLQSTIAMVAQKHKELRSSTTAEFDAILNGLNGGYILPAPGGDPIVNPNAISTGKNFYSINPETTPSIEAWKVGKRLAENILEQELKVNGKYPEKVSFTLWSSDFIYSEGATIAQILWMLGVEPLRDGMGYIRSLRLVPDEQLGRPRVDIVVQTSGQLRDIAASRLELINRAVTMAANANDDAINYVDKGLKDAEKLLLEKGFSPADARKYSAERIFGGVGGNYGTGITGMVEDSENWESQSEIAKKYIENMSGLYSSNGGDSWGEVKEGVFEAALLNTSVVVQPRASNTWGPLSLDHVYEFMGGLSAAVQEVTGNDPNAYFNDFRNSSRAKVQELKEAIGIESNSTIFNPKYIREMLKGEASSYGTFAETVRNTFGWNAMKPSAIDEYIWNELHEVYVRDKHNLGIKEKFSKKNPYAMQELTAVMLESARKGMWSASSEQLAELAKLHTDMVIEHEAGCSGFICDNAKLREFIADKAPVGAKEYSKAITAAREVQLDKESADKNVVLKKEEQQSKKQQKGTANEESNDYTTLYIVIVLVALFTAFIFYRKKRG